MLKNSGRTTIILVTLCVMIGIIPSVAVADVDNPDSIDWGDPAVSGEDVAGAPGDLKEISINAPADSDTVQFNITFNDSAPDAPWSDNRTHIYVDGDTDRDTGLNADRGGYFDNLDDIGADHRIEIGDGSNVTREFSNGNFDIEGIGVDEPGGVTDINTKNKNGNPIIYVEVSQETINAAPSGEIDLKFVYRTDDGAGSPAEDQYTWAPDPDNDLNDASVRFDIANDRVVKTATIQANVSLVDNGPIASDAQVEFTDQDGNQIGEITGSEFSGGVAVKNFSVIEGDFEGENIDVDLVGGENHALSATRTLSFDSDSDFYDNRTIPEEKFTTHGLINVSGNITDTDDTNENVELTLENGDGDLVETNGENPKTIEVTDTEEEYTFTGVNATVLNETKSGSKGILEANIVDEESLNTLDNSSQKVNASRNSPENQTVKNGDLNPIGIEKPALTLDVEFEEPNTPVDNRTRNGFTLDVDALADESDKRVDGATHVFTFDSAIAVPNETSLNESIPNAEYSTNFEDGEIQVSIVANESSELVKKSENEDLYELGFNLSDDVDLDFKTDQTFGVETEEINEETKLINSTSRPLNPFQLEDETLVTATVQDPDGVDNDEKDLTNTETEIESFEITHLTNEGDMVGSPTQFGVSITTNGGNLHNVTLYNDSGANKIDSISLDDDSEFTSELTGLDEVLNHTPQNSTWGGNSYFATDDRYEVEVYGEIDGNEKRLTTDPSPRTSQAVYNRSDVTGDGNVTITDVNNVLQNITVPGTELPWDNENYAQYDVTNDGEIDINDATFVAQDW